MTNQDPEFILWQHLKDLPYFRALLRAVEHSFFLNQEFPEPILDLGCGDGHFAWRVFQKPIDVGVDPWASPIREAHSRGIYRSVIQSDGAHLPIKSCTFASAFSNSVLEHIPHIDSVLEDLSRVLQPGGIFVFSVPNERFIDQLWGVQALQRLGFNSLAGAYSRGFNHIARHAHLDPPEKWKDRLHRVGMRIEQSWNYFSPKAMHVLEWGHLFGVPALVSRKLTGKWILSPTKTNLWLPFLATRKFMHDQRLADGVCTFYLARKNPVG